MLVPKKVKHRKWHKPRSSRNPQIASRMVTLAYGEYGLKATTRGWVTSRQIEAARRAMVRHIRKGGKIWIRIFPDRPVTTKGTHFTMGSGKGAPEYYVATVTPGTIMFEVSGVPVELAREAMILAAHKLPVKSKIITNEG